MTTAVVMPWRESDEHRAAARRWVLNRYAALGMEIVEGRCDPTLPFNRSECIVDGALRTDADVLIVPDADVWTDGLAAAVREVRAGAAWAIPHRLIHRLSPTSTQAVLAGAALDTALELDQSNPRDAKPYVGYQAGTLLVIRRSVVLDVPPDVRFVGWGHEEQAWALALRMLVGFPVRLTADLFHLWHPAQPRRDRIRGSHANELLLRRYELAQNAPSSMRTLVDESKPLWPASAG